jgi:hypothetical protein
MGTSAVDRLQNHRHRIQYHIYMHIGYHHSLYHCLNNMWQIQSTNVMKHVAINIKYYVTICTINKLICKDCCFLGYRNLVEVFWCFRWICSLHLQCYPSQTLVNISTRIQGNISHKTVIFIVTALSALYLINWLILFVCMDWNFGIKWLYMHINMLLQNNISLHKLWQCI